MSKIKKKVKNEHDHKKNEHDYKRNEQDLKKSVPPKKKSSVKKEAHKSKDHLDFNKDRTAIREQMNHKEKKVIKSPRRTAATDKHKGPLADEAPIIKFKDYPLDSKITRALGELGFVTPLEVQVKTIPLILEGRDLIVKSQTGSGKTAAFAIPLCEKIDVELERPQAIVLTPTRELAAQVKEDIADIGKYKGIRFCTLVGKEPMEVQRKELKKNPQIIVATPGRMMDHILNKNIKLQDIKYFIIDEADEMLLMGFKAQIEAVIKKLPPERTTLLFSATMPEEVQFLSQIYMINPENIEIEAEVPNIEKIEQIYYAVEGLKKVDFMKKMIQHEQPGKAMIFCNTQEQVNNLFEIMRKWNSYTCAVHGGMDQQMRTEKLRAFKRGEYRILISTDLAARGIHVRGITHVINYGVPFDHENYIHRIGRTGRVDERGIAITLVIPSEMYRFEELENFLGYKIPCKGGHVKKKATDQTKEATGKGRFKVDLSKGKEVFIQINLGKTNSRIKPGEILSAIRSVSGITNDDIGKIDMLETVTKVGIYNGKERLIIKAFETKKINGKLVRVKKG